MSEKETIKKYIESNLNIFDDDIEIADDDNIFEKGFVNSLFAMKLLNFVQQEFNIEIDDDDINLKNFSSINNMIQLIKSKNEA